jgi:uncharacterized membrane-anchored protein
MTTRWSRIVAAIGLVVALVAANGATWDHERTLREGRRMLLELAPVDPRSLMQGDYMALRFAVGSSIDRQKAPATGRMVVLIGEGDVARFARIASDAEVLGPGEALLDYRIRGPDLRIVTNAWFFQEGDAQAYQRARYGELRVRSDGQALLVGMRDSEKRPLGTPRY